MKKYSIILNRYRLKEILNKESPCTEFLFRKLCPSHKFFIAFSAIGAWTYK